MNGPPVRVTFCGWVFPSYGHITKVDEDGRLWVTFADGHEQDFEADQVEFDSIVDLLGGLG